MLTKLKILTLALVATLGLATYATAQEEASEKPWEVNLLDTLDFWKFGDYKNFASLKLLTAVFGIPTPKDDIDGSQVARVFYLEDDLPRITAYCQKDVQATAQVWLRMNGLETFNPENIEYA